MVFTALYVIASSVIIGVLMESSETPSGLTDNSQYVLGVSVGL